MPPPAHVGVIGAAIRRSYSNHWACAPVSTVSTVSPRRAWDDPPRNVLHRPVQLLRRIRELSHQRLCLSLLPHHHLMHGVHMHEILLLPHPPLMKVEDIGVWSTRLDSPFRRGQLGNREVHKLIKRRYRT